MPVSINMDVPNCPLSPRWYTFLSPRDLHIIFSSSDRILSPEHRPKVTVVSYNMLANLKRYALVAGVIHILRYIGNHSIGGFTMCSLIQLAWVCYDREIFK